MGLIGSIGGWLKRRAEDVYNVGKAVVGAIGAGAGAVGHAISGAAGWVGNQISNAYHGAQQIARPVEQPLLQAFAPRLRNIEQGFSHGAANVADAIKQDAAKVGGGLVNAAEQLPHAVGDVVEQAPRAAVKIIPQLAKASPPMAAASLVQRVIHDPNPQKTDVFDVVRELPGAAKNLAVSALQAAPREYARLAMETPLPDVPGTTRDAQGHKVVVRTDPLGKAILGSSPVETHKRYGQETAGIIPGVSPEKVPGALAVPLGLVAGALDIFPLGPGKGRKGLEALAGAKTDAETAKVLSQNRNFNLPPDTAAKATPELTKTSTPQEARKVIETYSSEPPPQPRVAEPAKVPVRPSAERSLSPEEVSPAMSQAAEATRTRYDQGGAGATFRKLLGGVNSSAMAAHIDSLAARKRGIPVKDLPMDQSVERGLHRVVNSDVSAKQRRIDSGVDNALKASPENTPLGKDMVNYLHSKFGIELAEKKGKAKFVPDENGNQISVDSLRGFAKKMEQERPAETKQARESVKRWKDEYVDRAVQEGIFTPEAAKYIKQYQNYAPMIRALPEELARPKEFGMKPIATLGRQRVAETIEGGGIPVNDSWRDIMRLGDVMENQINRQKLWNLMRNHMDEGVVPGKYAYGAKEAEAKQRLDTKMEELRTRRDQLIGQKKQARVAEDVMKGYEPSRNRVSVRTPIIRNLPGERAGASQMVGDLQSQVDQVNANLARARKQALRYREPETFGKQMVAGKERGFDVRYETTPEIAKFMQGLGAKPKQHMATFLQRMWQPFRAAWTGIIAPTFTLKTTLHYDPPMVFINSRSGLRTAVDPRVSWNSLKGVTTSNPFVQELNRRGIQPIGGSELPLSAMETPEMVAARGNIAKRVTATANSRNFKDFRDNVKQTMDSLDIVAGKTQHVSRLRASFAEYGRVYGEQLPPGGKLEEMLQRHMRENPTKFNEAMEGAAWAYDNILPNYRMGTTALRILDSVVPYTQAGLAGTRSFMTALRRMPAKSGGKALLVVGGPAVGLTAYNMSHEKGREYLKDQFESNPFNVFAFYTWVSPDAHKLTDEEASAQKKPPGSWEGVIKVPLAPELRATNELLIKQTMKLLDGDPNTNVNPGDYAKAFFNTMSGGLLQQPTGLNPFLRSLIAIKTNIDPNTGQEVVPSDIKDVPAAQQRFKSTSGVAASLSKLFGGKVSPIQVDFVLKQLGLAGKVVRGSAGSPTEEIKDIYTKSVGKSEARAWRETVNDSIKNLYVTPKNPDDPASIAEANKQTTALRSAYKLYLNASAFGELPWAPQAKAEVLLWLNSAEGGKLRDALRKTYTQGKNPNPMWQLPDNQLHDLLILKHNDPHWSGLSAPADEAQKDEIRRQPWYKQYIKDREQYTANLPQSVKDNFVQDEDYVVPNTSVQEKLNRLGAISDSTERSKFIQANKDVSDYFRQRNLASQNQRQEMGLYRDVTPKQANLLDQYQALKDSGQKTGGLFAANPELGALMGAFKGISGQKEVLEANAEGRAPKISGSGAAKRSRRGGHRGGKVRHTGFGRKRGSVKVGGAIPVARVGVRSGYKPIPVKIGKLM